MKSLEDFVKARSAVFRQRAADPLAIRNFIQESANCSLCRRKGAVMAAVEPEHFRLLVGEDALTLYQFNTRTAKHYFCKHCGIYTFHRPRTNTRIYRINVGCLEGVEAFKLDVGLNDGASLS